MPSGRSSGLCRFCSFPVVAVVYGSLLSLRFLFLSVPIVFRAVGPRRTDSHPSTPVSLPVYLPVFSSPSLLSHHATLPTLPSPTLSPWLFGAQWCHSVSLVVVAVREGRREKGVGG